MTQRWTTSNDDAGGRRCPMCGGQPHQNARDEWVCSSARRREFAELRSLAAKIPPAKPKKETDA